MGIDPTGLLPGLSLNKYETVVKDNNKIENNKLEIVKGKLKGNVSNRLLKIYKDKQFTFSLNNNTVLEYGGGPGSILGVGKTRIRFADQRTGQNNTDLSNSGFFSEGFRVFKDPRKGERTFNTTNLLKGITSESIYNLPNQTFYINTGENVKDILIIRVSFVLDKRLMDENKILLNNKIVEMNIVLEEIFIVGFMTERGVGRDNLLRDTFYNFNDLQKDGITDDAKIISQLNQKLKDRQRETNRFNNNMGDEFRALKLNAPTLENYDSYKATQTIYDDYLRPRTYS
jgi:hypothetical protein